MTKINPHLPYKNGFEAAVARDLGSKFEYEPKDTRLAYVIEHIYVPDFVCHETKTIKEAKGLWEADDRRKILAVKKAHPDWTITMVFQKPDKKISKTSKTSYSDWCTKHDIAWEQGPESIKAPRVKKPSKSI